MASLAYRLLHVARLVKLDVPWSLFRQPLWNSETSGEREAVAVARGLPATEFVIRLALVNNTKGGFLSTIILNIFVA